MPSTRHRPSGPCFRAAVVALALVTAAVAAPGATAQPMRPASPVTISVEDEVLGNLLAQPVDGHTIADFALPEPFLRRIADRIIRASYRERAQVVVRADGRPPTDDDDRGATDPGGSLPRGAALLRVERARPAADVLAYRAGLAEERPSLRGYRAPILDEAAVPRPVRLPADATPAERAAADVVARRLARDGLLGTLAPALAAAGTADPALAPAAAPTVLLRAGYPLDLLRHFVRGGARVDPAALATDVLRRLGAGAAAPVVTTSLAPVAFDFVPARRGFAVLTESGEHEIGLVRAQGTRGRYWKGPGAGGALDVVRQLAVALPEATFLVSLEEKYAPGFAALAAEWPGRDRVTVLAEPLRVGQWAQDNGKPGRLGDGRPATLVPRYASRRDDGSQFIPGDSFLFDTIAATGHAVVPSSLLFQGGNLLAVRDPASGDRILLVGEAEIHRNTALGLSAAQVEAALRTECAVDRLVVLPAVSFHIDYDVTVRAHDGRLLAFVNDTLAAAGYVLERAIGVLERSGGLRPEIAQQARDALRDGDGRTLLEILGPVPMLERRVHGRFPLSFAELFAEGETDSPVGNLQRFLTALDVLAAAVMTDEELPDDRHGRSYIQSIRRTELGRAALHERLRTEGFTVVFVPSLAQADRSLTSVNGVHDRTRYLMPAYGGLYRTLDRAAERAFAAALGPDVAIVPILCGESQRRAGAVHCSVAVYGGGER